MSPAEGDASYERRIVSVLFADLVGFTSLAERLDAEDVAAIQDRYFAAVRETVARHRGVLEKFIGDAAMAAFGVPVGRDDDAERAVRCGLAIAAAVERLHGELGLDPGDLAVRVGIATGEVVHAEDGPDAGRLTGDTVNTAARLQAAARPGGILISETTALAVADTIELGPPAELELKGKAAPVSAREATGVLAIRSRETAMGALRAPILGRETELGTLAAAVARSVTQRRSERWLIVAPPGTGKTRLVDELAGRVQADVLVRRVRFRLDDPRPFGAIADLAGDVVDADIAGRLETGGLTRGRAAVVAEALVGLAAPAREAGDGPTAGGRGTTGGSGPADRDRLFEAWLDGFAALAAPTGELWIAEDGHWASPDALAFIDAASGGPVPSGRLVVVTARPSLLETGRGWATTDPAAGRYRLDLAGLSARSAEALVRALVGDALGDPLVTRIAEASDGNCLYVEELLRSWASSGMLRQGAGGWTFVTSDGPLAIPATVHALYGVQLDDLPPLARATARRAAVAGRRFPVDALPGLGVTDPVTALASLDRRSLIAGPTPAPVVGATYAYRHALLRDAAYVSLARAERARLHVALAGWLEQVAGERVEEVAEAIGGHYEAALESASTLASTVAPGLDRLEAAARAAAWLERAADQATRASAHEAAVALGRRAVALTTGSDAVDAARRWYGLGRALHRTAALEPATEALERALAEARRARSTVEDGSTRGDGLGAVEARTVIAGAGATLCGILFEQLRFRDSWDLADRLLGEIGPPEDGGTAALLLARGRARSGETNEGETWVADAARAVAIAETTPDRHLQLTARFDLAVARAEVGDVGADPWASIATFARELGDWDTAAQALTTVGFQTIDEHPAETAAILAPAREIAASQGLPERLGWIENLGCEAGLASGDWDGCLVSGIAALDLAERHGYHRLAVRTLSPMLLVAGHRGRRDIVTRGHAWFMAARRRSMPDSPYGRILGAAADVWFARAGLVAAGPPDPEPLLDGFGFEPGGPGWLGCLATILGAWRAADRLDTCRSALEATAAALGRATVPSTLAVGAIEVERAAVMAAESRPEREVAAVARGSLPALRRVGAAWWTARALRLLEGVDDATPAELDEATTIEARLGLV